MAAAGPTDDQMGAADRPPAIEGYGAGGFRIDGVVRKGSLIVLPNRIVEWSVASFAEVDVRSLPPTLFAAAGIELLLLGCGAGMALPPRDLRQALRAAGIVIEVMDTGAAVRTYTALLGEQRRLAAALIAVD